MTTTTIPVPTDRRAELRIKIKSLAEEAKIIRRDVQRHRAKGKRCKAKLSLEHAIYHTAVAATLTHHRRGPVRHESRHAQLAYAYLRDRAYRTIERCREDNKPELELLVRLVRSFSARMLSGSVDLATLLKRWLVV